MTERTNNLTEGPILRAVLVFGIPMVFASLLQNVSSVADIYFVGKLGAEALAAVSIGGVVIDILWTFISGTNLGFRALISRAVGARHFDEASHVAHQGIIVTLLVSVPIAVVGGIFARPITILLGAEPSVVPLATVYFRIIIVGASIYLLTHALSTILQAAGDARVPTQAMLLVTLLTLTLEPLLIFGWGIVPALGVPGAAVGLILVYVLTCAYLVTVLFHGHKGIQISLRAFRIDRDMIWKILKIGIPRSFQRSFRAFAAIAMLRIVAGYGTHTLAAYGVGIRIFVLVLAPGWGLASVASTLVGQNLGANKPRRAEMSAWVTFVVYGLIISLFTAVFLPFGDSIMGLFNRDPEVIRQGARLLRITSPFFLFLALAMIMGAALGGSGDTIPPMLITAMAQAGVQ
ncbi:MAG: MATE family efflux transporter, partial [Deltaproteobacteria bacterium]|nr:MATE family efflux transporter [Deltaproteobacteria bacterium]